ncbi:cyclic-di-GMP phosphodiesterase [compost metagenome]
MIAEGVENEADLKVLQDFQCDTVQGYLFGRPVGASEVPEIFAKFARESVQSSDA